MTVVRALVFALLSSFALASASRAATQDYCSYGDGSVLIFIDRTTAYDDHDKKVFVDGFGSIIDNLSIGERVTVNTIADHYSQSVPVFSRCVPGCPEIGWRDWLSNECRTLQARADLTAFRQDLASVIRGMLDEIQSYKHSDIARTIAEVTRAAETPSTVEPRKLSKVYVFSDLLENSEPLPWPSVVSMTAEASLRRISASWPSMNGIAVYAFGFGRFHNKERNPLTAAAEQRVKEFWEAYFRLAGVDSVYIGQRLQ